MIDASQQTVNGVVRLKLYKGNVTVAGRKSDTDSLFDPTIATFEEDKGAYNQKDAEGFIRLNALTLRIGARRKKKYVISPGRDSYSPRITHKSVI